MVYLSIALSCATIVAIVWMVSTKDKRRKLILMYVALAAMSSNLLIHARWWDYAVVAFTVVMVAGGWAWDRRRRTRAEIPPRQ